MAGISTTRDLRVSSKRKDKSYLRLGLNFMLVERHILIISCALNECYKRSDLLITVNKFKVIKITLNILFLLLFMFSLYLVGFPISYATIIGFIIGTTLGIKNSKPFIKERKKKDKYIEIGFTIILVALLIYFDKDNSVSLKSFLMVTTFLALSILAMDIVERKAYRKYVHENKDGM